MVEIFDHRGCWIRNSDKKLMVNKAKIASSKMCTYNNMKMHTYNNTKKRTKAILEVIFIDG